MAPVLRQSRDPSAASAQPAQGPLLAAGPLEPKRALELLGRVADALEADLQPSTLLIDEAGGDRAVVDFCPDAAPSDAALQYLSPERIRGGDEPVAPGVYSLSAVLYRCLTGSVPFPRGRGRAVRFWHMHAPRPRPTDLRPELPGAIDGVIARGMAIAPAARHPTARAMIEDARHALGPLAGVAASDGRARQPQPVERRSRRKALAPLALAAVGLAAGAAGFIVAGTLDDPQPRPLSASAGPLQLAAPGDWRRSASVASPAALELSDPVSLSPAGAAGTRLVAGLATAAASVALLARVDPSPPSGELVSLGDLRARRYRVARLPGLAGPATIYLAPADRGIATVACLADRARAAAFMPRCERVAGSLRLTGGTARPAGPSGRKAAGVRRAFRRVNAARSRYRSRLDRSRTASAQAAAARALARVHVRQARALGSLRLDGLAQPGGRAGVRALERAARAYRAAVRSAVAGNRGRYAAAGRSAMAADAALRRALRKLRVVGYEV